MELLPRKLEFVIEVAQPTLPTVLKVQILKTGKTTCFYPFFDTRILGNRENTGVGYFTDRKWVLKPAKETVLFIWRQKT